MHAQPELHRRCVRDGSIKQYTVGARKGQPIDCFYVYPSVSTENSGNSTSSRGSRRRTPRACRRRGSRRSAASSRRCTARSRRTATATRTTATTIARVQATCSRAWRDYLAHANHGRGVVLIGHSAGRVPAQAADPGADRERPEGAGACSSPPSCSAGTCGSATARRRTATSSTCRRARSTKQFGCVVAYSTWDKAAAARTRRSSASPTPAQHVLCVNPAAPGGGPAPVDADLPHDRASTRWAGSRRGCSSRSNTDWVSYPGLYKAQCRRRGQHGLAPGRRR